MWIYPRWPDGSTSRLMGRCQLEGTDRRYWCERRFATCSGLNSQSSSRDVIAHFASGEQILRYEPAAPMVGTTGDIEALSLWADRALRLPGSHNQQQRSWPSSSPACSTSRHGGGIDDSAGRAIGREKTTTVTAEVGGVDSSECGRNLRRRNDGSPASDT